MDSRSYNTIAPSERTLELEKLLSLAEELHDKCESGNRFIERYRLIQLTIIMSSVLFAAYGIIQGYLLQSSTRRDFLLLIEAFALVYIVMFEFLIRRTKYRVAPDLLALSELVELIRETESVIAETEKWSTLERAQFRIRLSRFGIGSQAKTIITSPIRTGSLKKPKRKMPNRPTFPSSK